MRLNLPRYNCVHLAISSDVTVSPDKWAEVQALVDQTQTHDVDGGQNSNDSGQAALFGSRFTTGGIAHWSRAFLSKEMNADAHMFTILINIGRAPPNLPPPPRGTKPMSFLIDATTHLFGFINVHCEVLFEYSLNQGYRSKITFPVPLMFQQQGGGITHIDSAQFSSRHGDDILYRLVVVNVESSDSFTHSINFEEILELNRNSIRRLLSRGRSISRQFLIQGGEN